MLVTCPELNRGKEKTAIACYTYDNTVFPEPAAMNHELTIALIINWTLGRL